MPSPTAFRRTLLASLALAPLAGPAMAQMLDHGALEALLEEPVTTSATGKPQRASEVPVAMDIITAEQILRSGAHDIPTVLARYTSLDVQQYNEQDFSVGARGLTGAMNPRLLVLVDGRQVFQDDYGRTNWTLLPVQLTEIRQIEVVRGPNTALFGFNAVGGVVNIVTFNPAYDRVTNAVARLGTHGYREVSGVTTAPLGDGSGVRLSAGARSSTPWLSGYLPGETGQDLRTSPERFQFATNAVVRVADGVQLGFDAGYARTRSTDFTSVGDLQYFDTKSWNIRGRVAADTGIGLIEASVFHNGVDTNLRQLTFVQGVTILQLSDTVKLGADHTLRPFLEYRHNTMSSGGGARVSYDVAAIGAMWNWAMLDTLDATLAGRRDQVWLDGSGFDGPQTPNRDALYNRSFGTFGYNAGLVWRPTGNDTVRLSAARGIGMPSLFDLGLKLVSPTPFGSILLAGNPTLKPTVVDDYEIGYRRRVAALDASFGLTFYHQLTRDISSTLAGTAGINPGIAGYSLTPHSIPTLQVSGVELSGTGKLGRGFDWGVEYRLAAVSGALDPTVALDPKHASPRHLVSSRLGWGEGPYQADLFLRYASTASGWRLVDRTGQLTYVTVDDYASVGGRLAYRPWERVTLALEGSNLLSEKQRQSIGLQARRAVYASVRVDF